MDLRKTLLRIMLAALGVAALTGALGIFISGDSHVWRFFTTALITAVAVGLAMAATRSIDKPVQRPGSIAGVIWVAVAYLDCLLMIWSEPLPSGATAHLAAFFGYWVLCGLPAVSLAFSLHLPYFRIAARFGIAIAAITLCLFSANTFFGDSSFAESPFSQHVFAIAFALAVFGFTIMLSLANVGQGDRRYFRWLGIAAALAGFAVALTGIFSNTDRDTDHLIRISVTLGSLAALLGLLNCFLIVAFEGLQFLVLWGTMACALVCLICGNVLAWSDGESDLLGKSAGASGIATACGAVAIAVIARLNRRPEFRAETSPAIVEFVGQCPRCNVKQHFKLNGTTCCACNLRIEIKIEEPRCPKCNYLLYMLNSANCPECGTPIANVPFPNEAPAA